MKPRSTQYSLVNHSLVNRDGLAHRVYLRQPLFDQRGKFKKVAARLHSLFGAARLFYNLHLPLNFARSKTQTPPLKTWQRRSLLFFSLALIPLTGVGCAAKYEQRVEFNPLEPIRVAVLPFAFVNERGEVVDPDDSLFLDNIELLSSKLTDSPNRYVQKLVQTKLAQTGVDLVAPAFVDAQLAHRGFFRKGRDLDIQRVFAADPKVLGEQLFQSDALLYGKVFEWSRSYYGIQSKASVGIELELIDHRTGKRLFYVKAQDSDGRGLTKRPTGFSNIVLEPIQGLSNDVITKLATSMVDRLVSPLAVESRPEFLSTPPPAIFASAHDAPGGIIDRAHPLTVILLGSGGGTAWFSIGDVIRNVPMIERDPGHFFGQYFPLPSDAFSDQPVTVSIADKFGRVSTQTLGRVRVSLAQQEAPPEKQTVGRR